MAQWKPAGSPSIAFVFSMASLRRALPWDALCERPRKALSRFWRDHPGRLAQGPEEKCVFAGRLAGFVVAVMSAYPSR
jgi:hypothetical protein